MEEFRPVPGFEGLYELSRDGRLFAVERKILQVDSAGRKFLKTIKRHKKAVTTNGRGYPGYNLHKNNRQTCRLISTLLRDTWGIEVPSVPANDLLSATVSCSGLEITIQCDNYAVRDRLVDFLTGGRGQGAVRTE